jgi:hypothetical protein
VSKEEQQRQEFEAKLHPSLRAIIERLQKQDATPSADEAKFTSDGKAEVRVWLTDTSPAVLEQLKQLGFEVLLAPKTTKLVIGRLPLDKLAALAALKEVRYVAPNEKQ